MTGVIATIPRFQFSNALGVPLAGGKLYTYLAGTTTPTATYRDQDLKAKNENPITLDASGSCVIWLDPSKSYKFMLKSAIGITQWTQDDITGALASNQERPVQTEAQMATEGQKVFVLKKSTYTPGIGSLKVYLDGFRLSGTEYEETSSTSVTFTTGLRLGQEVLFETGSGVNSQLTVDAALIPYTPPGGAASNVQAALDQLAPLRSKLQVVLNVEDYYVAGESDATAMIQRAINAVAAAGGGVVNLLAKDYVVSRTKTESDAVISSDASGVITTTHVNTTMPCCLVLRAGVMLRGAGMGVSRIVCADPSTTVMGLLDMAGGGLSNLSVLNSWSGAGVGHGILLLASSAGSVTHRNMLVENVEIGRVGSYGIGAQYGDYFKIAYRNLYIHDTGADGIDHKVREGPTTSAIGVTMEDITVERFGLRLADSAGVDVRGPVQISNYTARDFGRDGATLVGIRLNAGLAVGGDKRQPSRRTTLTNFRIEANPAFASQGIAATSSGLTQISNGTIRWARTGVITAGSSSGFGDTQGLSLQGVVVEGAWTGRSFDINSEGAHLVNCYSAGDRAAFQSKQGNLAAGQTTFAPECGYDAASVVVYKNGAALTKNTDFTATDGVNVVLAAGVLATDVVEVVTPTATGYYIAGLNCLLSDSDVRDAITEYNVTAAAVDTLMRVGDRSRLAGSLRHVPGAIPYLEAFGVGANYDVDVRTKGSGSFVVRANGARALVAANPSNPVNWLSVIGSATGGYVRVDAAGNDADIPLRLSGKGAGATCLATRSGDPASPGDISFTRTSDAQLVVKMRGADGVVRSTTLNLA